MKELFAITAVGAAVMVLGLGLYLGLGYAQTTWSWPTQQSRYAYSFQQGTDDGYIRQVSRQTSSGWYCPGASYYGMRGYNGNMGLVTDNRGWHMGSGYGSETGNPTAESQGR